MFRPSTSRTFNGRINVAFVNARSYNVFQQHPVPNPRHAIFAFLISSLFNFLDLKYQGNGTVSPFQTHPITMYVALLSMLLYCFAYAAELQPRSTQLGRSGIGDVMHRNSSAVEVDPSENGSPPFSSNTLDQLEVVRKAGLCQPERHSPVVRSARGTLVLTEESEENKFAGCYVLF
ncbi:hypothetical protein Vadar_020777 [Vaccinium darrowii]|uniref:Uncharacterized protein n=1 Tax=Vaccinium darrowii TaxID=229202 RepID=A0ACB7ZE17_9ERIC|nr:hypothetical protein Vadar_020777 [Vaccinium darrowii]